MGVSHSYLTKVEVQQLLGVNAFGLWRLARKYDKFPKPTEKPYGPFNRQEAQEVWGGTEVYSWAAEMAEFAHRGAVLLCPLPEELASGSGLGYKDTVRGPALDCSSAACHARRSPWMHNLYRARSRLVGNLRCCRSRVGVRPLLPDRARRSAPACPSRRNSNPGFQDC
jgi:hypothetical protein